MRFFSQIFIFVIVQFVCFFLSYHFYLNLSFAHQHNNTGDFWYDNLYWSTILPCWPINLYLFVCVRLVSLCDQFGNLYSRRLLSISMQHVVCAFGIDKQLNYTTIVSPVLSSYIRDCQHSCIYMHLCAFKCFSIYIPIIVILINVCLISNLQLIIRLTLVRPLISLCLWSFLWWWLTIFG